MSLGVQGVGGTTVNVNGTFTASDSTHTLTFDREPKGIIIQDVAHRTGLLFCVGWWVNVSSTGWKFGNTSGSVSSWTITKSDDGKSITFGTITSGRSYSYIAFF